MKFQKGLDKLYIGEHVELSPMLKKYLSWYDNLMPRYPMNYYFTQQDIERFRRLARSPMNMKEKFAEIGALMNDRGFKIIGGGTNRRAYECIFEDGLIAKVPIELDGFTSNVREYVRQPVIKPFCSKIFGVTQDGAMSMSEKLVPFKEMEEFVRYRYEIFDILYFWFRNHDIGMDDMGTRSFKQWGIRNGFGPAIFDFPSMYVLDPLKSHCSAVLKNGRVCNGQIDYDDTFNTLRCTECGMTYFAKDLALRDGDNVDVLLKAVGYKSKKKQEEFSMKFKIYDAVTGTVTEEKETVGKSRSIEPSRFINSGRRTFVNTEEKFEKLKFHIEDKEPTVATTAQTNDIIIHEVNEEECEKLNVHIEDKEPVAPKTEVKKEETKPVEVKEDGLVSDRYSTLYNSVYNSKDTKISFEKMLDEFNRISNDTTLRYEIGESFDTKDLIKYIQGALYNNKNCFMERDTAFGLMREFAVATLFLPPEEQDVTLNDSNLYTASTYIPRLLSRMYGNTELPAKSTFDLFYGLIQNVRNTSALFEGIISFYNFVINNFSREIDETPNGCEYRIRQDIYEEMLAIIDHVIKDYVINVTYNIGNAVYNATNCFALLRKGLVSIKSLAFKTSYTPWCIYIYRAPEFCEIGYWKEEEEEDDDTEEEIEQNTEQVTEEEKEPETKEEKSESIAVAVDTEDGTHIKELAMEFVNKFPEVFESDDSVDEESSEEDTNEVATEEVEEEIQQEDNEEEISDVADDVDVSEPDTDDYHDATKVMVKNPIPNINRPMTRNQRNRYDVNGSSKKFSKKKGNKKK